MYTASENGVVESGTDLQTLGIKPSGAMMEEEERSTKRQRLDALIEKSRGMPNQFQGAQSGPRDGAAGGSGTSTAMDEKVDAVVPRQSNWTKAEDKKLRELVVKHGTTQWALIATYLPGRDRKRCRERYVNHLDPALANRSRPWLPIEDQELKRLQQELGYRWAQIARKLTNRSPEDAKNRFLGLKLDAAGRPKRADDDASTSQHDASENHQTNKTGKPRHWTQKESSALRELVETHGPSNWLFLASQISTGRTDLQCMQHWYQVLDPVIRKGKGTWTPEEDRLLLHKVAEIGRKWTHVGCWLTAPEVLFITKAAHPLVCHSRSLSCCQDESVNSVGNDSCTIWTLRCPRYSAFCLLYTLALLLFNSNGFSQRSSGHQLKKPPS